MGLPKTKIFVILRHQPFTMIKILIPLFLLSYFPQTGYSQQKNFRPDSLIIPEASCVSVDELSSYIKQNFVTDTAQIRAIYTWIANNISYDVARMQDAKNNPQSQPQVVADVLKMRRAVCQGYSDLFTALCKNVGINALVVTGYVKTAGKVMPMSHSWVAAELGGEWFLFDPTWGAGYVNDNHFVKRFNNTFYKQYPKDLISDHMPFDPLYQFLSYPKSNIEFIDGTPSNNKLFFNYKDSLNQHNQLSSFGQMTAELRRIEGAGIQNDLLQERKQYLKKGLQSYTSKNAFDESNLTFSKAITLLNEYFGQKNKQFSTTGDNDLLQILDSMKYYVKLSRALISQAVTQNDEQQRAKTNNLANIDLYWKQLNQEELFIQKYIATDKTSRRELFKKM
ncbi:MAG: transglutaminase domain-containing protein [Ferruginibacter sp.]